MLPTSRDAIMKVMAVQALTFIEGHVAAGTGFLGIKPLDRKKRKK